MKHRILSFLLSLILFNCLGQKKVVIEDVEREYLTEEVTEHLRKIPLLEEEAKQVMTINNEGLYIYVKDSTLVNANMKIALYSLPNNSTNTHLTGYLKGLIKGGKKEGSWVKEWKKGNTFVIVKRFNYSNGILDGKYEVFDLDGKVLSPFLSTDFDKADEKNYYETYKNGCGYYYDYYYDTGILNERGYYVNGKKHAIWVIYTPEGEEVKKYIYNNGIIINE